MAQIDITFNATPAHISDFCSEHRYQDEIDGSPNPETKVKFFKRTTKQFVYESVKAHRVNGAGKAARKIELDKTVEF